jgi:ribose/xylose/arabinose/galactoside ABC-type transport system permease subunit
MNAKTNFIGKIIPKGIDLSAMAPVFIILFLIIIYTIFAPYFLTLNNFLNILRQVSIIGVMAIGVTMVILLGEIDLSIGTVMAFSGMIVGGLSKGTYFDWPSFPVPLAMIISLAIGAIIGFGSGIACAKLKIPGFMATLSMQYICSGLMLMLTKARPIGGLPQSLTYWGSGYVFGFFPVIIIIFLVVVFIGLFLLKFTVYGRNLYAIGGNIESSRLSGINVVSNKTIAFVICSVLCSLAGILMDGRIGSAQVTAGDTLMMQPIAGAVLGGTSLMGGRGTIPGTVLGVLIMGILVNGLNLMGVGSDIQRVVTGVVLFGAVTFNIWSGSRQDSSR